MKNKELYELMTGISAVAELKGVKFAYVVAKNKANLAKEIETFQKAVAPSKEFSEYETERIELAKKHSKKKDGEPVVENNNFVMENRILFEKEFAKLQEKNKKVLDERKKQFEEFNTLLEEESDFKPFALKQADLPEEITAGQLTGIFKMVE